MYALAWVVVLAGTNLPQVLASAVFRVDPHTVVAVQGLGAALLVGGTVLDDRLRPLQGLALALCAVTVIRLVSVEALLTALGVGLSSEVAGFASIAFGAVVALVLLAVFLVRGDRPEDLSLRRSDTSAQASPERIPLVGSGRAWRVHGPVTGAIVVAVTIGVLALGGASFAVGAVPAAELGGIALLVTVAAILNAVTEEFVFRAAPLADLADALGTNEAMVLLGAFFGLSHFYGTPGGPGGILMAGFLGWWLTKSVLETGGLTVAVAVHIALDLVIFAGALLP